MPFAVFRQHQRKLLVVFAILAMIGFVLSDTLPRWVNSGGLSDKDLEVANLYGKKIHLSDLGEVNQQRQRANRFMASVGANPNFFGGVTRPELIDAIILQHEADRLGIPDSAEFARRWIDQQTSGAMNATFFESILARFDSKVSGEQLLIDMARQIRIMLARQEVAIPVVTPLDVYRNYKAQNERTSFKVVPFLVESFVGKVGEPTEAEVQELYEKGKGTLPDPSKPSPGFKIPRQVKVEFLSIDVNEVAKKIKAKLPEDEVKSYYEGRKSDFPMDRELPADLFLGSPELTPQRFVPFSEMRDSLADALSREKANEEVENVFGTIRDEVIDKDAEKYHAKVDEIAEAKKEGNTSVDDILPTINDLSGVAKKYNLTHEVTPLIDRRESKNFGRISLARVGSGLSADSKDFASETFDPRTKLYEAYELNDPLGERYLVRKIEDVPSHVADLKEVRDQVVHAWKFEKARPLALKAAEELAVKLRADGGQIKDLMIGDRPVTTISAVTKLKPGMPIPPRSMSDFRFQRGPATPTDLPQIPESGPALLDALFALKAGGVAVESDSPQSSYYVLTLDRRDPVSYMALMGPNGSLAGYWSETQMEIMSKAYTEGMARLREQAGYKPEDYPTEEQLRNEDQGN